MHDAGRKRFITIYCDEASSHGCQGAPAHTQQPGEKKMNDGARCWVVQGVGWETAQQTYYMREI